MANQPNKHIYNVVVVIWLTLSLGSVVLAGLAWSQLSRLMVIGRQNAAIKDNLDEIFKSLLETEAASRGYVITGDRAILQPLNDSQINLPIFFAALTQAVQGEPALLEQMKVLHSQADEFESWQSKVVAARGRSFNQAADLISTGEGKTLLDGIHVQMEELAKVHLERRAKIREGVSTQLLRASLTSLGAGILGLGAGLYAFWLSRLTLRHQQRERDLIEARLKAEHNSEEKNIFLANMSHEIRTPMNAILGFSELLLDHLQEPGQRHYLQSIRSSANSLLTLINDILDVSKIEAGVMTLRPEPTDSREICELVYVLFTELAAKKGIKLQFHLAPDLPGALLMDRVRLRQILVNLVGNAIKFTDHGSVELRVSWARQLENNHITLMIEVQDTGIGIPHDKLAAIFKPFAQSGAHREKENQGAGLGLAIVERLVELMGGGRHRSQCAGSGLRFSPALSRCAGFNAPGHLGKEQAGGGG